MTYMSYLEGGHEKQKGGTLKTRSSLKEVPEQVCEDTAQNLGARIKGNISHVTATE